MSTENITIPKGDYGFNLAFTVTDSGGTAYNLTGYTITLKVWKASAPGKLLLEGVGDITVAASGTCYYTVASGDFDTLGTYVYELELTKTGVVESAQTGTLTVIPSG